jgi:hypothetical protein
LLAALAAPGLVEGDATGRLAILASAQTVNGLEGNSRLEGNFRVSHGTLKRIDLAEALRQGDRATVAVRGGSTAFEDFSGTLLVDSRSIRLAGLHLSSGRLQAGGQIAILRPTGSISGGANVEMHGSAGGIRAPLAIGGNLTDPELRIGR